MHTYSNSFDVYDVKKLWQLAPKSEWIDVKKLHKCLKEDIWETGKTPIEHLKDKDGPEWEAMLRSDLRYALILTPDNDIADGNHRFMKAIYKEKKRIKVRKFKSYNDMVAAELDN